jgi:hypothetical protein
MHDVETSKKLHGLVGLFGESRKETFETNLSSSQKEEMSSQKEVPISLVLVRCPTSKRGKLICHECVCMVWRLLPDPLGKSSNLPEPATLIF